MFCPACAAFSNIHRRPSSGSYVRQRSQSVEYASFWKRFLAWNADGFFFLPFFFLFQTIIWLALPLESFDIAAIVRVAQLGTDNVNFMMIDRTWLHVLSSIWAFMFGVFLYYSIFEGTPLNATPGKMLLSLKVVDEDHLGASKARAALRTLARMIVLIPGLIVIGACVVYAWVQGTPDARIKLSVVVWSLQLIAVISGVFFIGIVSMFFGERKQCWHDLFAKTCVIETKPVSFGHVILALLLPGIGNVLMGLYLAKLYPLR